MAALPSELGEFAGAPEIAEMDFGFSGSGSGSDKCGDSSADLDAFSVLRSRKGAGIGKAVGGDFARAVFITVEIVDVDGLKCIDVLLPHGDMREAI